MVADGFIIKSGNAARLMSLPIGLNRWGEISDAQHYCLPTYDSSYHAYFLNPSNTEPLSIPNHPVVVLARNLPQIRITGCG